MYPWILKPTLGLVVASIVVNGIVWWRDNLHAHLDEASPHGPPTTTGVITVSGIPARPLAWPMA